MEFPPIRDVDVPLKYEQFTTLERFIVDSEGVNNTDIAQFIAESGILDNIQVRQALMKLNVDITILIAKNNNTLRTELIEFSKDQPELLHKCLESDLISLQDVLKTVKEEKNIEYLQEFLKIFSKEIPDPSFLISRIPPQHQNALIQNEDQLDEEEKAQYEVEQKLIEIFKKDDLETLISTLDNDFDLDIKLTNPRDTKENAFEKINLLDFAAFYGAIRCFTHLLEKEFSITQKTLVHSIFGHNIEILKMCMEKKSFPRKVLLYTVESHNYDAFDIVINKLREGDKLILNQEIIEAFHESLNYGKVLFYVYLKNTGVSIQDSLFYLKSPIFVEDLFQKSQVNMINLLQQTPLFCVNDLETIKLLIEKGIDVNRRDKLKRTAIFIAALKNDFKKVKLLIEKGAKVYEEYEIIRNCISAKLYRMARLLLNSGAPIDEQSKNRLYQFENYNTLEDDFSDEDDMYVMMEAGTGIFHKNQEDDISSDGYSDFELY